MARRFRLRASRRRLIGALVVLVAASGLAWVGLHIVLPFPYANIVEAQARRNGLDPALVAAVIRVESGYQPDVVSDRGARGLMQIMPETARWIRQHGGGQPAAHINLSNPGQNIALGSWFLAYLLGRYAHNTVLALAAYNSGPAVTDGWIRRRILTFHSRNGNAIPYPETRYFVARVLRYSRWYRMMYGIPRPTHNGGGG